MPKSTRAGSIALWFALFLDLVGFGMLIPDLQLRAERMGAAGWQIGGFLASTFIIQLLVSPHWGRLSDRVGRKSIFILCQTLSALAMLIYGFAVSPLWILASRIIGGFGAANVAIAQSLVADQTEPLQRTAAMAKIGAAISAGLIVGPSIGGHLSPYGNSAVGFTAAGLSMIGILLVLIFTPDAKPDGPVPEKKRFDLWAGFRLIGEMPGIRTIAIIAAVSWFSLAMLEGTFGRLIARPPLNFGEQEFGHIFSFESLLALAVQGLLMGWIAKRFSDVAMLTFAYISLGLGLALMPYAPSLVALFGCSALFALGQGISNPTINALCSRIAPEDRQGELFGLLQSARSAGFIFGPILGGALFDIQPAAPYLTAGVICVIVSAIVVRTYQGKKL